MKWSFYYLYVILDVFSRYVTGWMIAYRETVGLAQQLIKQSCEKQQIPPGQLTIHADRGSSMTSKSLALMLADLGVVRHIAARTFPTTILSRECTSKR